MTREEMKRLLRQAMEALARIEWEFTEGETFYRALPDLEDLESIAAELQSVILKKELDK